MSTFKPQDTIHIIASVGTSEVELVPYGSTSGKVPTNKFGRVIYGLIVSNTADAANTLTIKIYAEDGTTVEASITLALGANETKSIDRTPETPILLVPAGKTLKAVAGAASVSVVINAYDI